jgi:lipoprotein-anchoring transpeptidase ErfK/SrfK
MRTICAAIAILFGFFLAAGAAQAKVRINVDLASQSMHVSSASGDYVWPISSARSGYVTPRGTYAPTSLQTMHRSRKYHNSPMPHSIFFNGGYAIHGTYEVGHLGRPASHGCIRLSPANAAALFQMVKAEGASISITGTAPGRHYAQARRAHGQHYAALKHHPHRASALAYAPQRRHTVPVRQWQQDFWSRY